MIRRDDRFGCLKLATDAKLEPRDFIRCSSAKASGGSRFTSSSDTERTVDGIGALDGHLIDCRQQCSPWPVRSACVARLARFVASSCE